MYTLPYSSHQLYMSSFDEIGPPVSEKFFCRVLTIYHMGMGDILVM